MTIKDIINKLFTPAAVFCVVFLFGFLLNVIPRLVNVSIISSGDTVELISPFYGLFTLTGFILGIILGIYTFNKFDKGFLLKTLYLSAALTLSLSVICIFTADVFYIYKLADNTQISGLFDETFSNYLHDNWWLYCLYFALIGVFLYILKLFADAKAQVAPIVQKIALFIPLILPLVLLPYSLNCTVFTHSNDSSFHELSNGFTLSFVYLLLVVAIWSLASSCKKEYKIQYKFFMQLAGTTGISAAIAFCIPLFSTIYASKHAALAQGLSGVHSMQLSCKQLITNLPEFIPLFLLLAFSAMARQYFKKQQFNQKGVDETTGSFGTAKWATEEYLAEKGAYDPDFGALFGKDSKEKLLYCPIKNRTIIAAPGGGKGAGIAIPALLTEDRPVLINDIKGELWAVTARQRAYGFGRERKVVAIDPFGILKQQDYAFGKSEELLQIYTINPFEYISQNEAQRDRDINALVSALVVKEGDNNAHWDDNAEILLSGLVDFALKTTAKNSIPNLMQVYNCMIRDVTEMEKLLQSMKTKGGYAEAAAGQVLKTAPEERGSIYSTTYRQLKWLVDVNMQKTFCTGNFDLRDFMKGDMDIFVVIPEDQIIFHQRVFRLLFALVTNILSQTPLSQLPKKEILFILDELGQYGYCKDVERAIEILRARRAVIWAFFQGYGQIKLYKKPDLFTNANIKQIFETDDEETMKWIQTIAGKETILTKTLSKHQGDSRQKTQVFGGTLSKGDGENVHETGRDLIHINEIRELAHDEQFVFIRGWDAIKCKKLAYHKDAVFKGKFDRNPFYISQDD